MNVTNDFPLLKVFIVRSLEILPSLLLLKLHDNKIGILKAP